MRAVAFDVHMRCAGCLNETVQRLAVPPGDGHPADVDDLLDSGALQTMKFECNECDSPIGLVVAINVAENAAA